MNIALFSDSWLPTKSGIVTVVIQLKKILETLGHHVVVVTVKDSDVQFEDPLVFRVKSLPSPMGEGQYMGFPNRKEVIEFVKAHNVQIIHSHTEFFMGHSAIVTGQALNIPVIASTHTMWEDYYRYYIHGSALIPKRGVRKAVKHIYRKFYAFINVSKKAQDYFTEPFMLPHIPSAIIPNAIDTENFSLEHVTEGDKAALRAQLGILESDRVILYVGRVVEEKRVMELLEVIIRVVRARPQVKMLFVGDGGAEHDLRERVRAEGLSDHIIFTGFVDWFKLSLYYAISHIFVTVSLSEMHSMTVLEAIRLSLPVVCRRDTSFLDTVFHGKNGFFAETDEEMDDYLYKLIDNPSLCNEMAQCAYTISCGFSLRLHGLKSVAFYEEVLRHFPNPVTSEDLKRAVEAVSYSRGGV